MKPPRWRTLLSYLFDIHLESRSSAFNPDLNVVLSRGQYQLYTANAVYSFGERYDNFRFAFEAIDLDRHPFKDVLLLGLGLGSIPWMLERRFARAYHYTAVEIDEEVIRLAGKYALDQLHSPMEVICADALAYVELCRQRFDLICMDIFEDDTIPDAFESAEFLEKLKGLLRPRGLLLYNRLASNPGDRSSSGRFFRQVFKPVFPTSVYLSTYHNMVLFSDRAFAREGSQFSLAGEVFRSSISLKKDSK